MATSILEKIVDAEQWEAEDMVGRLGMVMHAAFLLAGFQPCGAEPPPGHHLLRHYSGDYKYRGATVCLFLWYTAPALAHRKDAAAAVLLLSARGSTAALAMFLTAGGGSGGDTEEEKAYLERLDVAGTVRPVLSRGLAGDAGVGPRVSRICRSLAGGVCRALLDDLLHRNGHLWPGFTSLPDDLKALVLKKLADGRDLASVECVSSQLRRLVAERDDELWKALYEALPVRLRERRRWSLPPSLVKGSWKHMYLAARAPWGRSRSRDEPEAPSEPKTVVLSRWRKGTGGDGNRREVQTLPRRDYNRTQRHGAIHSPSARYRWNHR